MYQELKSITVKKTRKIHECNASIWLRENIYMIRTGEIKLTIAELRSVVKAKQNKWMIPVGSTAIYCVGLSEGTFFSCYVLPEIHQICIDNDLYDE